MDEQATTPEDVPDIPRPKEEPVGPTPAEEAEAVLDAAIDEAFDDPDEKDLHVAAAGKKGARAAAEDEDEDEEPAGEEADAELEASGESEDEDEESDDEADMALHRAYTTLHDWGAPASVLKKTSRAELIAWAKRVEVEGGAAPDGASKTAQGRETPQGAKEPGEPAQADAETLWATARAALAEKLGIDEDAADALKPLHDRMMALESKLATVETSSKETLAAAREREGRATINAEVQRLQTSYPELRSDEDKRQKIEDEAMTLAAGLKARGKRIDPRVIFDKAAMSVLGAPKRGDLAQLRRNGASNPPETIGKGHSGSADSEQGWWEQATEGALAGKGSDWISRLKQPAQKIQTPRRRW